jgi:hypothetical protein
MRHRFGQLWHLGRDAYSSDVAFTIGANLATAVVFLWLLTWLVLAIMPPSASDTPPTPAAGPGCSWLEGQCW